MSFKPSKSNQQLTAPLRAVASSTSGGHNQPMRQQYRVLDDATRNRRAKQLLDQLERDNFHEDPHANLVMSKKAPKFEESPVKTGSNNIGTTSGGNRRGHVHKTRMLTFAAMVEEDSRNPPPNYTTAAAPVPDSVIEVSTGKVLIKIPPRHFCSVCGFKAPYTCVTCGNRYCSIPCLGTHRDTRCLKWTA